MLHCGCGEESRSEMKMRDRQEKEKVEGNADLDKNRPKFLKQRTWPLIYQVAEKKFVEAKSDSSQTKANYEM